MGRIEVIELELAEFLAPQRCIVAQRQHEAVAEALLPRRRQDRLSLLVRRYPRKLAVARYQASSTSSPEALPRSVLASPDWIVGSEPLLNQVVVEEAHHGDPLLEGGVG